MQWSQMLEEALKCHFLQIELNKVSLIAVNVIEYHFHLMYLAQKRFSSVDLMHALVHWCML